MVCSAREHRHRRISVVCSAAVLWYILSVSRGLLLRAQLAFQLREMCQAAKRRLWIASPYVGSWQVRRILGRQWWDNGALDVRLLTDKDEEQLNRETVLRFSQKGTVKTLRGLHGKVYIADDAVLLTSANLTITAFSRKHELGVILNGATARSAIAQFKDWWEIAKDVPLDQVTNLPKQKFENGRENNRASLPTPSRLPPDPGDFGGQGFVRLFGDYSDFLKHYRYLAEIYSELPRVWPKTPLYLEIDGMLDYLYHHGGTPSKPYTKLPPRELTDKQMFRQIRRWATEFQKWAKVQEYDNGTWRRYNSRRIRTLLAPSRISTLTKSQAREVAKSLNCMGDPRVLNRFLDNNRIAQIRKGWSTLIGASKKDLPIDEMSECAEMLYGFKRSSVQELLGWYAPAKFPLRNRNVNAGMRFLGFDTRPA